MVVFIADEFANNSTLEQNLGTSHRLGGAEQDDAAMLWYVSKEVGEIPRIQCPEFKDPNPDEFYIIGNFATMSEIVKAQLAALGNYIIYEHDHKYCATRNPSVWSKFKVPEDELRNLEFYECAKLVICMTKFHQDIVAKNVTCRLDNIGGSFWMPKEFNLFKQLSFKKKQQRDFVYDNVSPHKGLSQSENYCQSMGLPYDKLPNQDTRMGFLERMAEYNRLVFMPQSPETCSRLVVEAKMMGLTATVTPYIGAAHESWFKLNGPQLVDHLEKFVIPEATEKIVRCLSKTPLPSPATDDLNSFTSF